MYPIEMTKQLHLAPFDVKEWQVYSKVHLVVSLRLNY